MNFPTNMNQQVSKPRHPWPKQGKLYLGFWIVIVWILAMVSVAFADSAMLFTLRNTNAPFEPVPSAQDFSFAEDAKLLTVDFIDRGASDSILLRFGTHTLLVDGAINWQFPHIESVLHKLDVQHFDYLLNTHAHDDHIQGLIKILARDEYTVDAYLSCYTDDYTASKYQLKVRELLTRRSIPYHRIGDGDYFTLGDAAITVYRDETPGIDKNRHSLVLKVVYGQRSVLLMADASSDTQKHFLSIYPASEFKADVLKVAHHGYINMNQTFLDAVDPMLCVVTNSKAAAERTERQLSMRHTPRYYTNSGVVRLQTDGETWLVEQMPFAWPREGN